MAVGIIQLVAKSKIDVYLTSDPQITLFKIVYRRHTNFAIDSIIQKFSSRPDFGSTVVCTLSKAGDLVSNILLYIKLPEIAANTNPYVKYAWLPNIGHRLIESISVEIADQVIDKQYGEWLYIWSQLAVDRQGIDRLTGNVESMYQFTRSKPSYDLYVPINFWFCRTSGLALPLVSLQSTNVKIYLTIRKLSECLIIGPTNSIQIIESMCPFNTGDYIQQKVKHTGVPTYAKYIDYDWLTNTMYWVKLKSDSKINTVQDPTISGKYSDIDSYTFKPYRIYNPLNQYYVTPKPNISEKIESTSLLYKKINILECWLYVDYVYLDKAERLKFTSGNNQYLIEQTILTSDLNITSTNINKNVIAVNPIKSIYWTLRLSVADIFNYTDSVIMYPLTYDMEKIPQNVPDYWSKNINDVNYILSHQSRFYGNGLMVDGTILIDGTEKFTVRNGMYFNIVQPYQHNMASLNPGIYTYGFCIYNYEYQPSGSINPSMTNGITMSLKLSNVINSINPAQLKIYTTTYNILNIWNGNATLLFENVVN